MPVINTNLAANSTLRYVNINSAQQQNLLTQLSSGLRVNKASDDASALSIASKIKADSITLGQAAINAGTATAVLNTADGGYSAIANILSRLKAIATAAQAGTLDVNAFANVDKEYQALLLEITSVTTATKFNGVALLDGAAAAGNFANASGASVLLGTAATDAITIKTSKSDLTTLTINGTSVTSAANAVTAAGKIDAAIATIAGYQSQGGADTSRVTFRTALINVSKENADASVSSLLNADVAQVQTQYTSADVLTQSGIAALQKANAIPQELLRLLQS